MGSLSGNKCNLNNLNLRAGVVRSDDIFTTVVCWLDCREWICTRGYREVDYSIAVRDVSGGLKGV